MILNEDTFVSLLNLFGTAVSINYFTVYVYKTTKFFNFVYSDPRDRAFVFFH